MRKVKSTKLKAADLLKNEDVFKRFRKRNYRIQYDKCIDTIQSVNEHCHLQFTTYTIPAMIPGEPHYDMDECTMYLKEELRKADFYVRLMKPGNVLYISWKPNDVEKVQKLNRRMGHEDILDRRSKKDASGDLSRSPSFPSSSPYSSSKPIVEFNPDSALSNLHFTTSLMLDNPKYDHLESVKRIKAKR